MNDNFKSQPHWRFDRPDLVSLTDEPKLTVDLFITCRNGQTKLDLTLAALVAQTYPTELINVHVIDDGSSPKLVLPEIKPVNTSLHYFENTGKDWGKSRSTNSVANESKADVLWFLDSDMVVDPDHLAQHMKWHHDSDDYVVLGWKRFVESWNYHPAELLASLKAGKFAELHAESESHGYWEARVKSSNGFKTNDLDNFRGLVGATFSIANKNWSTLGGYNENFITSEDTELGWRVISQGLRLVPESAANSWHLGLTTIENNRDVILQHNNPLLAGHVPGLRHLRRKFGTQWLVPENQYFVDCRNMSIDSFFTLIKPLLQDVQGQTHFTLLANWPTLNERYSPISDDAKDLREIQRWTLGDNRFTFQIIADNTFLSISEILDFMEVKSSPYLFFSEGNFKNSVAITELKTSLQGSDNGLEGVVDHEDQRIFVVYGPALATAKRLPGSIYQNIELSWGLRWHALDDYHPEAKPFLLKVAHAARYMLRRFAQVRSFDQFIDLVKRGFIVYKGKIFKRK
jgi:GT2 family glycosyltransferase